MGQGGIKVVLLCTALCAASASFADDYWAGIASFRGQVTAQGYMRTHAERLPSNVEIRRIASDRGDYFRLLAGPYATEQQARTAVEIVKQAGFESAWLVFDTSARVQFADQAEQSTQTSPNRIARQVSVPDKPSRNPVSIEPVETSAGATELAARSSELPAGNTASGSTVQLAAGAESASVITTNSTIVNPADVPDDVRVGTVNGTNIRLTRINPDTTPITIDGHLDEQIWQRLPTIEDFVVLEPDTLQPGEHPSILRVAYSDKGLYVAADFHQPRTTLVKRLSGRDVRDNRDSVSITIDTSGEGRYGFWFGVNLGDSLMDGTVLPERNFTSDWDGPWYGRSQETANGWSAEMFIPWGVVSMPVSGDVRNMGMYVSRKVAYKDERWGWPALPPTKAKFMSSLANLQMENVEPRQQYSVYPFLATAYSGVEGRQLYRAGADVFWRPSSNFQLNATLNPDFGNVESDEVVINLTATETFFPEKRLFFLEGQEIFFASPRADTRGRGVGNQGAPYTMVNTRRIGGKPREPLVGAGVDVPQRELVQRTELVGAFKTTGQIGRLRYGVLGAAEEDVKFDVLDNGQPRNLKQDGNDYGIARLLYEDTGRGAYKALGVLSTAVLNPLRDAVVHGVDWHFLSAAGGVKIDGQYMMSDIDGVEDKGYGGFLDFEFTYRQGLKQRVGLEYFDENIDINDLGFLQRNNHYRIRSALSWTRSNLSFARENQFDLRGYWQKSVTESLRNGGGIFLSDRIRLNDLSQVVARVNYFTSFYDDLNSFGNGTYEVEDKIVSSLRWDSDSTQQWSYGIGTFYGEEDLGGQTYGVGATLNWRPSDRFAVEFNVAYDDREGWLLHQNDGLFATFDAEQWLPRVSVEYFISARQQLRLSFQYVGIKAREDEFFQVPARPNDLVKVDKPSGPGARSSYDFSVSQFSLQARYRWEIAPLSDIFLVYTRQADLRTALGESSFNDLFNDAWQDPLADVLVFKIRYRFGS